MALTIAHGPVWQRSTHLWAPAVGDAPPILNDRGDTRPATMPWTRIRSIPGWRATPEIEDNRDGRTAGPGEVPYPIRELGKPLVYKCEVQAETEEDLILTLNEHKLGFSDQNGEGVMTVTPYGVGEPEWEFSARVIDFSEDENLVWERNSLIPFRQGFLLSLRMSDTLFYTGGIGYK